MITDKCLSEEHVGKFAVICLGCRVFPVKIISVDGIKVGYEYLDGERKGRRFHSRYDTSQLVTAYDTQEEAAEQCKKFPYPDDESVMDRKGEPT